MPATFFYLVPGPLDSLPASDQPSEETDCHRGPCSPLPPDTACRLQSILCQEKIQGEDYFIEGVTLASECMEQAEFITTVIDCLVYLL